LGGRVCGSCGDEEHTGAECSQTRRPEAEQTNDECPRYVEFTDTTTRVAED